MTLEDLDKRFTFHAPSPAQVGKYNDLRSVARFLARTINDLCPECREKSLAVTALEESVMWANAAIARNE